MGILVQNSLFSLRLSLTVLRFTGFWPPEGLTRKKLLLYNCYGFFWFMFILGIFLITEVGDLFNIWGNLPLMTGTAFILFTNLAHTTKFINIVTRRETIIKIISNGDEDLRSEKSIRGRNIIESCNREVRWQQLFYYLLTLFTCAGWAGSAEKDKLPLRAWYPYNTNKYPVYEITYMHQVFSIFSAALLNVSKDTLVTTLIAQCRCRLRLVGLSLRTLNNKKHFTEESKVQKHVRKCIIRHQKILETVSLLQNTFSEPTFAQFTVSLVIICATAFQLVSPTRNYFRVISMGTYLLTMMFQVFIYCYQGNQLSSESEEVAGAAYDIPWYAYSVRMRKFVLIIMTQCHRAAKLTAGGFTTLSLNSFTGIIKTSYSFFTLLQQVTESK